MLAKNCTFTALKFNLLLHPMTLVKVMIVGKELSVYPFFIFKYSAPSFFFVFAQPKEGPNNTKHPSLGIDIHLLLKVLQHLGNLLSVMYCLPSTLFI